jgi:membrane-bound metal-dependent hydrolase YbcI (DUF457 family)
MFIGHQAVAFAAKRAAPRTSLGVLMGAAMLLDLLWPVLVLAGVEMVRIKPGNTAFTPLAFDYYPFSHSLVTSLAMSVLIALVYWRITRYAMGAWAVGAAVFSHWVLDFVSHGPDMPLAPGISTRVGLGLWNSVLVTLTVEILMFAGGLWLYTRTMRPNEKSGRLSLWILVGFLGVSYLGNAFGPPPPNPQALAWVAMTVWLLPLWAGWVDRQRLAARNHTLN